MTERVLVASGGHTLERGISLASGNRVQHALAALGYDAWTVDVGADFVRRLREFAPRFVFNVVHGRYGEDGTLQDLFEILRIPYTGSDAYGSALCFDKHAFKSMCVSKAIPTPMWHSFTRDGLTDCGAADVLEQLLDQMGLPLVVKPARGGSAMGLKLVRTAGEFLPAVVGALSYGDRVIVERHVAGRELAITMLGPSDDPRLLPVVEIESDEPYYTFTAHYEIGVARMRPADVGEASGLLEDCARRAFVAAGCRDLARADLILDGDGVPQLLEINTIPGLTETGPTPFAVELAGMKFQELIASMVVRVSGEAASA